MPRKNDPAEQYRQAEQTQLINLESAELSSPSLEHEIRTLRLLLRDALEQRKDSRLAADIIKVIASTIKQQRAFELESSDTLTKHAATALGQRIVSSLIEEISHIDGWEEIADRVVKRLKGEIDSASNTMPKQLPLPRPDSEWFAPDDA